MTKKLNAVFAHDHRFVVFEGKFHSRGGLPEAVLNRYSSYFGSVKVVCRAEFAAPGLLMPIDNADISFFPQKDIRKLSNTRSLYTVARNVSELVSQSDVVIARLPSTLGWLAARAARKQSKPYLVEVVGNGREASALHGSKLGFFFGEIEHLLTKQEIRQARHATYITKRHLQTVYPSRGTQYVCPNVSVAIGASEEVLERQRLFPRQCNPKIGLVGSLNVNYKGHDVAINTVARLIKKHELSNVSLHFAGGGTLDRWKQLARVQGVEEHVTFHGSIAAGSEMIAWIDDMDIMLQPSLTEGQGRSIVEAMSRGKPVVASDTGGIPELLASEWMTHPKDAAGLAARCAMLLQNPQLYGSVAARNLSLAQEFDEARIDAVRRKAFAAILNGAAFPDKAAGSGRMSA